MPSPKCTAEQRLEETVDAPDESMKESGKRSAVEANILLDLDLGGQELVASHGRFRTSGSDGLIGWSCERRTYVDCFLFGKMTERK